MTTQIAIGLGAVILLAFGLDAVLYHSACGASTPIASNHWRHP